jgi:hypothetical protein
MRLETTFFGALTDAHKRLAEGILSSDIDNFQVISGLLELDPKEDYKYIDLRGVDFSDSDIRGYDFTGSDLRGTTGINVKRDGTTIILGARLEGSLFEIEARLDDFFRSNEAARTQLGRLSDAYWTEASTWVGSNVRRSSPHLSRDLRIAMALFRSTMSAVVRSDIIYFSRAAFTDGNEYCDFLMYILSKDDTTPDMMRTILRIIAQAFSSNERAFHALVRFLRDDDLGTRIIALQGLVRSQFFVAASEVIAQIMEKESEQYARLSYFRLLCSRVHRPTEFEDWLSEYQIDPHKEITLETIAEISRNWGRQTQFKQSSRTVGQFASRGIIARVFQDLPVLSRVVAFFRSLEVVGLRIRVDDDVALLDTQLRAALAKEIEDAKKRSSRGVPSDVFVDSRRLHY